ncbi:MAG: MFS transporter [Gammaproteobacteria bacterium]|nr:MFS transporter [Gammaproteobacteria bacterium]
MNKNIWLLASGQALMMTNNALLVTTSALVGVILADQPSLATLPLALQFLSTMLASIPAALLMDRLGRRAGFLIGSVIGLLGGILATAAIFQSNFWLFCGGTMLIGMFNGFGNYYRFAAVDVVSATLKSRAISYVMAGGVVAAIMGPNIANWTHNTINSVEFAGSYMVVCLLYVLTFILLSFTDLPRRIVNHSESEAAQPRPLADIIKQPVFVVAVICGMLGYAVMSLVMTATPLAMSHHHSLGDTAFVIQWHVLGMFAPSFVTGNLISRYGVQHIMLAGAALLLIAVLINLLGISVWHYWFALLALGIGWNFLFIGATDLLTYTYTDSEKARAQAFNDFSVFGAVTLAALTAGYLQHNFGWQTVNLGVLPLIAIILLALVWLKVKQMNQIGRIELGEG